MNYCIVFMLCFFFICLHEGDALTRAEKRASKQLKRCYFSQKYPCLYSDQHAGKVTCLDRNLLCDGTEQCPRGDDEKNCAAADQPKQLTNVALDKPTTMSSVDSDARPAKAMVDGDACMSNVFASTKNEPNPWAMIDLQGHYVIQSVKFQPHYSFPVPNLTIEVGDDPDIMSLCYRFDDRTINSVETFQIGGGCEGRYVRFVVQSDESLYLTIVEAEVYSIV